MHSQWFKSLLGVLLLTVTGGLLFQFSTEASSSARQLHLPLTSNSVGFADEDTCIECHAEAEHFKKTGHANTLRPVNDPASLAALRQIASYLDSGDHGISLTVSDEACVATSQDDSTNDSDASIELEWCFGSGHHAMTWAGTLPDSSGATDQLEFRWTWFGNDRISVTPGQPADPAPGHFGQLGQLIDGPKAARCFGCHASILPTTAGQIQQAEIRCGVGCQRCHGPLEDHVTSSGEVFPAAWKQPADQMTAIHRCAECHRRADELTPEEIDPNNIAIVRFQPVGLVQSKCFTATEMTCTTCHDPHVPFEQQWSNEIEMCVQCHDPSQPDHVLCAAEHRAECLDCHMPKIKMDAPVHFTDHWIRVFDDGSAP